MINSTSRGQSVKPYPDFPLTAHSSGRWCKKIRQRTFYFGPISDPQAALDRWLKEKDDLLAGRVPRARQQEEGQEGQTLRDLCNEFLTAKKHKLDLGELSPRTFGDLYTTCERIVKELGRHRLLSDIRPQDFSALQRSFPKTWGPHRRGREIQAIRCLFRYAMENDDTRMVVIKFGTDFKKPEKKIMKRHRAKTQAANGLRMFEAAELRKIIDAAPLPMKAMILLGINCGFGNNDVATLPLSVIKLESGWLSYPRPKTGEERRCKLWPETVTVLREAIAARPTAKNETDGQLVFLSYFGLPWVRAVLEQKEDGKYRVMTDNGLCKEFSKILKTLGLKRRGLNFYALRHTLETIGGDAKDQVALDRIMGHSDDSMAEAYREKIPDHRLEAIATHVHDWLFPETVRADQPAIIPMAKAN
jgi:integrase